MRGGVRFAGGAIDDHQTGFGVGQQTVRARHHGFHLRRAGDANQHHVTRGTQLGSVGGQRGACVQQILHTVALFVDRDRELLAFGQQIFCHAVPHEARCADVTNLHVCLLLMF